MNEQYDRNLDKFSILIKQITIFDYKLLSKYEVTIFQQVISIKAVGIYYLHINDKLEGGALKFRQRITPDKTYARIFDIEINRYLMPKTDTAVVFDNKLPHRFDSMNTIL